MTTLLNSTLARAARHGCAIHYVDAGHYEIYSSVRANDVVHKRIRIVTLKQLHDKSVLDGICRGIRLDVLEDAVKALRDELSG